MREPLDRPGEVVRVRRGTAAEHCGSLVKYRNGPGSRVGKASLQGKDDASHCAKRILSGPTQPSKRQRRSIARKWGHSRKENRHGKMNAIA